MNLPSPRDHEPLVVGLLLVFIAVNLLWYANRVPFFHEEPRRAIVAQEMLMSDNYVVPTAYQVPYYKKPPLQNWLIALASSRTGVVSGFSARAVSVAALLVTGAAVYFFVRRRHPALAWPAFLIATTTELMGCEYGNKVEPDMLLTAVTTLSFFIYLAGPTHIVAITVSSLFMGAGILTKGLSPLFFYPPVLFYLLVQGDERRKRLGYLALHFGLALVLPALWLWNYHVQGDLPALIATFSVETSARHSLGLLGFIVHALYFPFKIALVLVPWSLVLVLAYRRASNKSEIYWTCLYAGAFVLLVFTLLPAGRSRYVMPVFPLFAIAAAWHIDPARQVTTLIRRLAALGLASLCVGLGVRVLMAHAYVQTAILFITGLAWVLTVGRVRTVLQLGILASIVVLVAYVHGLYFYRAIDKFDYAALARRFVSEMDEDLPVVVNDDQNPKWVGFYLEAATRRPVYSKTIANFDRYYYISIPDGGHHKTGWTIERVPADNHDAEAR